MAFDIATHSSLGGNVVTDKQRAPRATRKHRLRWFRRRPGGSTGAKGGRGKGRQTLNAMTTNAMLDCGWGRLLFGQTFADARELRDVLRAEGPDRRDIAFHISDPHVVLAAAPQELFLDPSHTFRLDLSAPLRPQPRQRGFFIRRLSSKSDAEQVNRIYMARQMVPVAPDFFWSHRDSRAITILVAEDAGSGDVIGTVMGVDHARAFNDPERGSSLWCLAVDPQARHPRIGESLVRRIAEHCRLRGAAFLDLSVLHDNEGAIALYEKLGFARVPLFAVKRKNPINEPLFTGSQPSEGLNPYAAIIVNEAVRRGIHVEVSDAEGGFFRLTYGGRSVRCRESLSEFTSGVAMSICDDKAVTRRVVANAGVGVPEQMETELGAADVQGAIAGFLQRYKTVVVKPARGEQGKGVAVGLTTAEEVAAAIEQARSFCDRVIIEQMVEGLDLRIIVIDYKVVAAALRMPPRIVGDGAATIRQLIDAQSRRRAAATKGESTIPVDAETERCLARAGHELEDVLPEGAEIQVRNTANLHTGGTIHDVTDELHPQLAKAAIAAARAIEIPVVGIDFMVKSPREPGYAFIEANERPGLANHEPQPTAERFVDLLFPLSVPTALRRARS
jgi:GNAT-family acetyltransferase (TIGR03103 family)